MQTPLKSSCGFKYSFTFGTIDVPLFTDISILSCVEVCILRVIADPVSREKPIYFRKEVCSVGMVSFLYAASVYFKSFVVFKSEYDGYDNDDGDDDDDDDDGDDDDVEYDDDGEDHDHDDNNVDDNDDDDYDNVEDGDNKSMASFYEHSYAKKTNNNDQPFVKCQSYTIEICIWIRADTRSLSIAVADPVEGETKLGPKGLKMI